MANSPSDNPLESLDRLLQTSQANLPAKALTESSHYSVEESPVPGSMDIAASVNSQIKCHQCQALNLLSANFCRNCGFPIAKTFACSACQAPIHLGDKFCHHCGAKLTA